MSFAPPSLAVAIPTKNRPDDLDITVESVLSQTVLPKQLIVVDQSADSESRSRLTRRCEALPSDVRKSINLVYVHDPSLTGASEARNRALKSVNAEIVLFLDDDVLLERDFNERILEAYRDRPEAAGISGIVVNYPPLPAPFRYWTRIFTRGPFWDDRQPVYWQAHQLRESAPIKVTRLTGCLMSFPIAAIGEIFFDENLRGAREEDIEFCLRLCSGPLFIAPKAQLVHRRSPVGRSGEHWLHAHSRASWYLYQRHWKHGFRNRFYFIWLNIGYTLVAMLASMRRLSLVPCASLLEAIREARDLVEPRPQPGADPEAFPS